MKKCTFLTLLMVFLVVAGYAQEKHTAPSSQKLRKASPPSQELLSEAQEIKATDPNTALKQVKEALEMSLKNGDTEAEAKCYLLLGEINQGIGEWKLALENFLRAQALLYRKSETEDQKRLLQGLGHSYLKLHDLNQALDCFQKLEGMELSANERADNLVNLSEVYNQMGDEDQALAILDKSQKTKKTSPRVQNQKGRIYSQRNELDAAQGIYYSNTPPENQQSDAHIGTRDLNRIDSDQESLLELKEDISQKLVEQKRYDEEIALRSNSITWNFNSKNLAEVSKDKRKLGSALAAKGETAAAIKALHEAIIIADTTHHATEKSEALLSLANLFDANGNPHEAIKTFRRYSEAVKQTEKENEQQLAAHSDLLKTQREIEELTKSIIVNQKDEALTRQLVFRQQIIIYGLLFMLIIILVTSYFIFKNAKASRMANQLLALKSLRSQMNPHFIFNALNSVNQFIAKNDERTANKFLTEFSTLMRLVLDNSHEDFIPLNKEEEILSLYLKLEHYRFRDKFEYSINFSKDLNKDVIMIPPMLIQPYIENAVWHGLRYKSEHGFLSLNFQRNNGDLLIEIKDNGIGRKKSNALKTENQKKHQSTGLKNIEERLRILNSVYKTNYQILVTDLEPTQESGTHVTIHIPLTQQHESGNY